MEIWKVEELEMLQTQKMVQMQLTFQRFCYTQKGLYSLFYHLDNFENVIINTLEKDPNETFQKRMKGKYSEKEK